MGYENVRKVLRRGAQGQACLPIDDPLEEHKLSSQLAARLVLIVLADYANDNDPEAWPSVETIVKETGLNKRSVQRGLRTLERSGLVEVTANRHGGASSRRYFLRLDEAIEREVERAKLTEGWQRVTGDRNDRRGDRNGARGDRNGARGDRNGATGGAVPPEPLEPPTNTSGTTMNGGGGGGEDGERRSAPRQGSERRSPHLTEGEKIDAYEGFLLLVEERAKAEGIDVTFDRSNKAGRDLLEKRLHAGWKPDRLVERLFRDKWAKPKSPNGFLISRLKQIPEAPDYYEKRDAKKKQKETEELTRLGTILDEIIFDKSFGVSTWYRHFGENSTVLRGIEDEFGSYRSAPAQKHARKNAKLATTVLANITKQLIDELSSSLKADLEWFLDVHTIGETPNSGNLADDLEASIDRYRRLKQASEQCAPGFGFQYCPHQKEQQ